MQTIQNIIIGGVILKLIVGFFNIIKQNFERSKLVKRIAWEFFRRKELIEVNIRDLNSLLEKQNSDYQFKQLKSVRIDDYLKEGVRLKIQFNIERYTIEFQEKLLHIDRCIKRYQKLSKNQGNKSKFESLTSIYYEIQKTYEDFFEKSAVFTQLADRFYIDYLSHSR